MANQPTRPTHQWFRLASMTRSAAAPAQPPPPPKNPTPPPPQPPAPPRPSGTVRALASTQPSAREEVLPPRAAAPAATARAEVSDLAPKIPPESPRRRVNEPTIKIPELAEEKTVLLQKTLEKPREQVSKETSKEKAKSPEKHSSDFEDKRIGIITLGGKNQGARMKIFHSASKHDFEDSASHVASKSNGNSSNGKESPQVKSKHHKASAKRSLPMRAFINSNFQGINNSLVWNSSLNHHDPGVCLSLPMKPSNDKF